MPGPNYLFSLFVYVSQEIDSRLRYHPAAPDCISLALVLLLSIVSLSMFSVELLSLESECKVTTYF